MIKKGITVNGASLLLLGITFKENCPDVRNTKIVDVVAALADYGIKVTIYNPLPVPQFGKANAGGKPCGCVARVRTYNTQ